MALPPPRPVAEYWMEHEHGRVTAAPLLMVLVPHTCAQQARGHMQPDPMYAHLLYAESDHSSSDRLRRVICGAFFFSLPPLSTSTCSFSFLSWSVGAYLSSARTLDRFPTATACSRYVTTLYSATKTHIHVYMECLDCPQLHGALLNTTTADRFMASGALLSAFLPSRRSSPHA